MKRLIGLAIFLASGAHYGAHAAGGDRMEAHPMRPDADLSAFEGTGAKVHRYPADAAKSVSAIPRTPRIEGLIRRAGLEEETARWETGEKEILFLNARNMPRKKFLQRYKHLDRDKALKFFEASREAEK